MSHRLNKKGISETRGDYKLAPRGFNTHESFPYHLSTPVDLGEVRSLKELSAKVEMILSLLVKDINEKLRVLSKYTNDHGQVIVGGLAEGAIQGNAFSEAIVDEFQTMGSTLTDDDWLNLD